MRKSLILVVVMSGVLMVSGCGKKSNDHEEAFDKLENIINKAKDGTSGDMTNPAVKMQVMSKVMIQQQKIIMPIIMSESKIALKCLEGTDDKEGAEACYEPLGKITKKIGELNGEPFPDDKEGDTGTWDEKVKQETISEMKKSIKAMDPIVQCVQKIDDNEKDAMTKFIACSMQFGAK